MTGVPIETQVAYLLLSLFVGVVMAFDFHVFCVTTGGLTRRERLAISAAVVVLWPLFAVAMLILQLRNRKHDGDIES